MSDKKTVFEPDWFEDAAPPGILDAIQKSGAAMSHHHGIGKMTAPWLEAQIGMPAMDVYRALKRYFDPHGIMNPGGKLGLDLPPELQRNVTKD
jgi:alkyldihydroxyacetonephosphate synthase